MKILLVTDLYPLNNDRTIPKVIEDFALGLNEIGHEIEVLRGNFLLNSFLRKHQILKNEIYYRYGIKIYNKNFFLPFIGATFENNNYDLIISHMPSGHILASEINQKLKLPHIAIVHQSDYKVLSDIKYAIFFRNRLKKVLKNASKIGARNFFLTNKLKADFTLPSYIQKEQIVENKKINNEKLKLITLSKLIKRKNIDKVIVALSQVDFDFEYSIYGEGKEKEKLQNLIKEYNLEEKIKIYNHIPHNQIWEKLDENDVFILPSINETFGISYLEAIARGLIVVGTKGTGIDGYIQNKENGFLIEPSIEEIKSVLIEINKTDREKIVNSSLLNIQNFTKEKIMNKYNEIIKKTLWN